MSKALKITKFTFVTLLAVLSVGVMIFTIISVNVFNREDRSVFGFSLFIVLSDSMSATDFDAGDLILTTEVDFTELEKDDIVTFISQNPGSYGQIVTHKIREVTTNQSGQPALITYGTTTNTDDKTMVTEEYVIGKYAMHIPKVGTVFEFLKTPVGYLVCILIPFLALILYQTHNCVRLFRKYRQEQWGDVKAERVALQTERAENEKMLEELRMLREQLAAQTAGAQTPPPASTENAPPVGQESPPEEKS